MANNRNTQPSAAVGRAASPTPPTTQQNASQSRRLQEPLDESGAPLASRPGTNASAFSAPASAAAASAKMGNASIDPESSIESEIRLRAYERFIARQGSPGDANDDWCCAEREIRDRMWSRDGGEKSPRNGA